MALIKEMKKIIAINWDMSSKQKSKIITAGCIRSVYSVELLSL